METVFVFTVTPVLSFGLGARGGDKNLGNQLTMTVQEIKNTVTPILLKHDITRAGLFGSVVRGDVHSHSDVDMLVEFGRPVSLFDFVGVKLELEEKLHTKVDLVEYKAIKPALKENILSDTVNLI